MLPFMGTIVKGMIRTLRGIEVPGAMPTSQDDSASMSENRRMALLAEEIVEEWLNRQGYFTIRGVKIGVHEMDLLAVRFNAGAIDCRQTEVQASVRPVSRRPR